MNEKVFSGEFTEINLRDKPNTLISKNIFIAVIILTL